MYGIEELESLRREARFASIRTLVILIASTWFLYLGVSTIGRFEFPYQFRMFLTFPVIINAFIWLYWGMTSYLRLVGFFRISSKSIDDEGYASSVDSIKYSISRQQRRNILIEIACALQLASMSLLWIIALMPQYQ